MNNIEQLKNQYPLQLGANTPILRTVCKEVLVVNKEVRKLHQALLELMREHKGVGIAAPQIGQNFRMAAITQRDTSKEKRQLEKELVLINPRILSSSQEQEIDEEACLSLPNLTGNVARPQSITISYEDLKGNNHILKASGYNARIILHEMDHLDGVLFIDKLVD